MDEQTIPITISMLRLRSSVWRSKKTDVPRRGGFARSTIFASTSSLTTSAIAKDRILQLLAARHPRTDHRFLGNSRAQGGDARRRRSGPRSRSRRLRGRRHRRSDLRRRRRHRRHHRLVRTRRLVEVLARRQTHEVLRSNALSRPVTTSVCSTPAGFWTCSRAAAASCTGPTSRSKE